jgi:hypothetical protein
MEAELLKRYAQLKELGRKPVAVARAASKRALKGKVGRKVPVRASGLFMDGWMDGGTWWAWWAWWAWWV